MAPFKEIKAYYDANNSAILSAGPNQWGVDVYGMDWTRLFSFIEDLAWNEIRDLGMILYPQYPIGGMFADFASPKKMIVVECDGAAFHNKEDDAARDLRMQELGWTVYRIPGRKFMRDYFDTEQFRTDLNEAREEDGEEGGVHSSAVIQKAAHELSQSFSGVFLAIAKAHFGINRLPEELNDRLSSIAQYHMTVTGAK